MKFTISPPSLGLLGHNIDYSLSPQIHTFWLQYFNIPFTYQRFDLPEDDLPIFVHQTKLCPLIGYNVTIPYKEKIMPFLDQIDEFAQLCGAVNTVKIGTNSTKGYNTDGEGFFNSLGSIPGLDPGWDIMILGAGGAAKGLIATLIGAQYRKFLIAARNEQKVMALQSHFSKFKTGLKFIFLSLSDLQSKSPLPPHKEILLINTLPININLNLKGYKGSIYDIRYHSLPTNLAPDLKTLAAKHRLVFKDGREMLVRQAALSFTLWTNKVIDLDLITATLAHLQTPSH